MSDDLIERLQYWARAPDPERAIRRGREAASRLAALQQRVEELEGERDELLRLEKAAPRQQRRSSKGLCGLSMAMIH
jgi:hypothetical protein